MSASEPSEPASAGSPGPDRQMAWAEIARSPEFVHLERSRRVLTAVLLGIFAVALGVFLVLCGYARSFMRQSVDGGLTVAYVWLLALTVLAWILALIYLRFSERRLAPAAQELRARWEQDS